MGELPDPTVAVGRVDAGLEQPELLGSGEAAVAGVARPRRLSNAETRRHRRGSAVIPGLIDDSPGSRGSRVIEALRKFPVRGTAPVARAAPRSQPAPRGARGGAPLLVRRHGCGGRLAARGAALAG